MSTPSQSPNQTYRVLLCGELLPGRKAPQVAEELASTFGVDRDRLIRALTNGKETVVRRDVDEQSARRYVALIDKAGARCRLEPSSAQASQQSSPPPSLAPSLSQPPSAPPATEHKSQRSAWAAYVGVNAEYYVECFEELSEQGEAVFRPSWNWAACLVPVPWALYRKQYLLAVALMFFGVPCLGNVVLGLFGNYLYFRHVQDRLAQLKQRVPERDLEAALAREGGVHGWVPHVVFGLLAVGILSAVALPFVLRQRAEGDSSTETTTEKSNSYLDRAKEAKTRAKMRALVSSLQGYIVDRGAPPNSLDEVARWSEASPELLVDSWGEKFSLEKEGSRLTLRSAGPDRVVGTYDDLTQSLEGMGGRPGR